MSQTSIMTRELLESFISRHSFDSLQKMTNVLYPLNERIVVSEYAGDSIRLFKKDGNIRVLFPRKGSVIQESALTNAIANGTIFADAEKVDHHAHYLKNCMLPMNAIENKCGMKPEKLHIVISSIVGKMDDDGKVCNTIDITNGENFIRDAMNKNHSPHDIFNLCNHHLNIDKDDRWDASQPYIPDDIKHDISDVIDEIDNITDTDIDDEIGDFDFDTVETDNDEDEDDDDDDNDKEEDEEEDEKDEKFEECFVSKKPKRLIPLGTDILDKVNEYIESGSIDSPKEKSSVAGYISRKLEMADFYLNCIDTDDARYIVPHDRAYLVTMQEKLDDALRKVLQIIPIERSPRIWDFSD